MASGGGSRIDMKVVLLGKEFAGKTSIFNRFISHRFDGRYQATIGNVCSARCIKIDGFENVANVCVWDTAGSERYEAMARMYYRGANAAIVCYDPLNPHSWNRLVFWLRELKQVEENCKLYLCSTKQDLIATGQRRLVDIHNVLDFADSIGAKHFATSSITGENVEELFETVVRDFLQDESEMRKRRAAEEERVRLTARKPRQAPGRGCC